MQLFSQYFATCLGSLSGLLDVLVGQLVVVRTEHLHGANVKADLLEGICITLVVGRSSGSPGHGAASRRCCKQRRTLFSMPFRCHTKIFLPSAFSSSPLGSHSVEVVLVEGDADQRMINLGNDVVAYSKRLMDMNGAPPEPDGQRCRAAQRSSISLRTATASALISSAMANSQVHGRNNKSIAAQLVYDLQ